MKKLIKILLVILIIIMILLGIKITLKKDNKQVIINKKNIYGIKDNFLVKNKYTYLGYNYYYDMNDSDITLYDKNNNIKTKFSNEYTSFDIDNKYIYIFDEDGYLMKLLDHKGNVLLNKKSIIVYNDKEKYFISDKDLLDYNLNKIYTFNKTVDKDIKEENIYIYNDRLYITSNGGICLDLKTKKIIFDNFDELVLSSDYSIFHSDKYYLYHKTKKIDEFDKIEQLNYYDSVSNEQNKAFIKLINKNNTKYLMYNKIVDKPLYKKNNKILDLGVCSEGAKVKDNNKYIVNKCLNYIDILGDLVSGSIDEKDYLYLNGKDISNENFIYHKVNNYMLEINDEEYDYTIYNKKGKKIGNYRLEKLDDIYYSRKYFLDKDLKQISKKYNDIVCYDNYYCRVENEIGLYALYYKNKRITDFKYSDINLYDDYIVLKNSLNTQVVQLEKGNTNLKLKNIENNDYKDINIDEIKKKYNVNDKLVEKHKEFFRKYAYIVENNKGISNYRKYVYDIFNFVVSDEVYKYLNEENFLSQLSTLTIEYNESIGTAGLYHYGGGIELREKAGNTLYHELMHFVDYNMNVSLDYPIWNCNNKIVDEEEISKYNKGTCQVIDLSLYKTDYLVESFAELYSAKNFNKGVASYIDINNYMSAIEHIIGSEKMNDIYYSRDRDIKIIKLFVNSGISLEEYQKISDDLSYYTYQDRYPDYVPTGKIVDSLIDLYNANIKDKKWYDDKEFVYILKSLISIDDTSKYKNSKYKNELDKIVFKSFDDYNKFINKIQKDIKEDITIQISPIPTYIINDKLYLGTVADYNVDSNNFISIRYDFDNDKLIEYTYPIKR